MLGKKGFTMQELLITVVIMGVLATLSIGYLMSAKENVANSEANANLKSIQVAEKAYSLDSNGYYPSSGSDTNIGSINTHLKLSLPSTGNIDWNYAVFSTGCGQATRNGGDGRVSHMNIGDNQPSSGGCS